MVEQDLAALQTTVKSNATMLLQLQTQLAHSQAVLVTVENFKRRCQGDHFLKRLLQSEGLFP